MLKFARRFKSTSTLVRADVPTNLTRVAQPGKNFYELQEYQQSSLQHYFNQDALLFPVETIIQKTQQKDYQFFLSQGNFLKVADTLEKFQSGMLDVNSPAAKNFIVFKKQLYQMYQVSNRSVHEHELFSFNIERENLKWLMKANDAFIAELQKQDALEQIADFVALRGYVFKRKILNPRRLKGIGALATTYGLYSYMPYLAAYLGATIPMVAACTAGLYGMLSFAESQMINSIKVIDSGDNQGKLIINVAQSVFVSKDIIVDVRDMKSVVAMGDEELGEDAQDGNIVQIDHHFDAKTGKQVNESILLTLPGDAFRDKVYMDWILSDKSDEGDLVNDYHSLMQTRHMAISKGGKLSKYDEILARSAISLAEASDQVLTSQIEENSPVVDENLRKIQEIYGKEYLKSISDRDLYNLYKKHTL